MVESLKKLWTVLASPIQVQKSLPFARQENWELQTPNHELLNLGFPHQHFVVVRSLVGLGNTAQFEVKDSRHQLGLFN